MAHGTQYDLPVIADLVQFDDQSGSLLERLVFNHRAIVMILCALVTLVLGYQATKIYDSYIYLSLPAIYDL